MIDFSCPICKQNHEGDCKQYLLIHEDLRMNVTVILSSGWKSQVAANVLDVIDISDPSNPLQWNPILNEWLEIERTAN